MQFTNADASANIITAASEGRLVQGKWHSKHEGRAVACLLGSMHPSVKSAADCNGDLMPLWMAELSIALFDGVASTEIIPVALRYGALVGRWHVLGKQNWDTLLTRFLIRTVDDAAESAQPVCKGKDYWPAVEKACRQVCEALKDGGKEKLVAAANAAYAANAAANAANAAYAAYAAYAANAAYAAAYAAYAAANAAAYAAANAAANAAKKQAAYLRLFTFLMDLIEQEIEAAS